MIVSIESIINVIKKIILFQIQFYLLLRFTVLPKKDSDYRHWKFLDIQYDT